MAKKTTRRGGKGAKGASGGTTSRARAADRKANKRKPKTAAQKAARQAAISKRVKLHSAAALLKDFHGGKLPVKSGCGRPRGS